MVLAAGIGNRMRPLTDSRPKPLVEVAGRALIDHNLDRLAAAKISTAVINLHHFADLLEAHLRKRAAPKIEFSDERALLLDTGGGIAKALPLLGTAAFFLVNSDSLWLEKISNLARLADAFDPARMDAMLLLARPKNTVGYEGRGDYFGDESGRLRRRATDERAPLTYAGGALLSPALFESAPAGAFPLLPLFDRAQAKGRLFGLELDGLFLHVGTPAAIPLAEDAIGKHAIA
ncbi:MAG TPA: nucleotidyltransferase family protein [Xanthobacteraceae bacterium]|nr:nucleotidyltransferase family protein [Xanthobacteraceae bacterium]